jgi:hypothetical protein
VQITHGHSGDRMDSAEAETREASRGRTRRRPSAYAGRPYLTVGGRHADIGRVKGRVRFAVRVVLPIAAVALLALLVEAPASSGPRDRGPGGFRVAGGFTDAPFGAFAGYAWTGRVESIGASFTVPRIAQGSPRGQAATWIGVQGQGPPARFAQVAVIESRYWSARAQRTIDRYAAVWADRASHFLPATLFNVGPGDTISARLSSAAGGWRLVIADQKSGRYASLLVREPSDPSSMQAEWTQEDPGFPTNHARYPQIEAPRFEDLRINGRRPSPGYLALFSRWMSVDHRTLAPSAVRGDSFTLEEAPALSPAAAQYLRLTDAEHDAVVTFDAERSSWTSATPHEQIAAAVSQLDEASEAAGRALLSARWPNGVASRVRTAADADAALLDQAKSPAFFTSGGFAAWNAELTRAWRVAGVAGAKLRLALGLPGGGSAATPGER